jgi:putative phosphoserine phosphatase/1-acylglycerol-3-phosphate O-acyltransferase
MGLLGWTLDVSGEDRIREGPPAVYVLNHSSVVDTGTLMALWPPLGVCIGKKQLIWLPGFGQAFALMGNLLVDRGNSPRAVASVRRMTETVRANGFGVVMAPEGTRSLDGRLGAFKKGFAHIAIDAGLPILPIVLHNAHTLWPHKTLGLKRGAVRVQVLPPIPTEGWTKESLEDHVDEVRRAFVEALDQPGD